MKSFYLFLFFISYLSSENLIKVMEIYYLYHRRNLLMDNDINDDGIKPKVVDHCLLYDRFQDSIDKIKAKVKKSGVFINLKGIRFLYYFMKKNKLNYNNLKFFIFIENLWFYYYFLIKNQWVNTFSPNKVFSILKRKKFLIYPECLIKKILPSQELINFIEILIPLCQDDKIWIMYQKDLKKNFFTKLIYKILGSKIFTKKDINEEMELFYKIKKNINLLKELKYKELKNLFIYIINHLSDKKFPLRNNEKISYFIKINFNRNLINYLYINHNKEDFFYEYIQNIYRLTEKTFPKNIPIIINEFINNEDFHMRFLEYLIQESNNDFIKYLKFLPLNQWSLGETIYCTEEKKDLFLKIFQEKDNIRENINNLSQDDKIFLLYGLLMHLDPQYLKNKTVEEKVLDYLTDETINVY